MALPGPTNMIEEQAAVWAARAAYGDMTPESGAELHAWLDADRRHQGAYLRARAGIHVMEDAVTEKRSEPASSNDNSPAIMMVPVARHNGWFRRTGIAMAASLVMVAAVGGGLFILRDQQGSSTEQRLSLSDGSVATLARGAKISFAVADGMRKVTVLNGAATFSVAKDKAHPFVVRSGDVYAQATGTVYSVERVGQSGGTVHVREGSVLVWARDERDQAVLLHAGGKLTLEPGDGPEPSSHTPAKERKPSLPPPELAQISLDDVPVAAAIVRFNRVNETKIMVADPEIGKIKIVGLFRANDPEQFAQAAAAIAGAQVTHRNGNIVIYVK